MATAETKTPVIDYEGDETAWLEAMAGLIRAGRVDQLDYSNLAEFLSDMAKRDRRDVTSRLTVLIAHLLKWRHQPERRGGGWRVTIETQRQELAEILADSRVLRNHAVEFLGKSYTKAVRLAAAETNRSPEDFPSECPYSFEDLLAVDYEDDFL